MMWTIVVPLKPPQLGKSRLRGAVEDASRPRHESIVIAFARDTLLAAAHAPGVAEILLVCDAATAESVLSGTPAIASGASTGGPSLGGTPISIVLDDPPAGLNAAVRAGEAAARAAHPERGIAALSADLPCLTPSALGDALRLAQRTLRSFAADRPGLGTTLLCARPGESLAPQFGIDSAAAHAGSGAVALSVDPALRADVDTLDDLVAALVLGVGPATASLGLVHLSGGS